MNGELVFTTTSDFVRLHGFYRTAIGPLKTSTTTGSVDAAVLLHGLGGNFYSSRLLSHFSQLLIELGLNVVVANTRGHDMINTTTWSGRAKSVGAALERVSDCQFDVDGWVNFLIERGNSGVLVLGHSLGAIKALYAQANQPHPKVRSIVCLSATRLSYEKLIQSGRGQTYRDVLKRCQELVDSQNGEMPVQVEFPFPTWMTPRCYLEKYGPEETYNWLNFIDKVDIPTLLTFGEKELVQNAAFEGIEEDLEKLRAGWNCLTVEIIEQADHFYTSQFDAVSDIVARWLTN